MKLLDRISEALGLYEEDDEIIEETPSEQPEEKPAKKSLFSRKSAAPVREVPAAPAEPEPERKSFFKTKTTAMPASKTISIPMAQKQVKVIVLEPVSFDDSQKIADYLNGRPSR